MSYEFFYMNAFSQWHKCQFTVDGIEYNCTEQYMMHQKALFFKDEASAEQIMKTNHPHDQKALGRKVKNFVEAEWNAVARDIVYKGNYAKFQQNKNLLSMLMATKCSLLVEASYKDKIWGIGLSESDARRFDANNWQGTNWLGEVLTKVRDDLEAGVYRTKDFDWK